MSWITESWDAFDVLFDSKKEGEEKNFELNMNRFDNTIASVASQALKR